MDVTTRSPAGSRIVALAGMVTVVAALYLGREILIPCAMATLLSFLLAPLVIRFRHWGLSRALASVGAVILSLLFIGVVSYVLSVEVLEFANRLPDYQRNIEQKIDSVRLPTGGLLNRVDKVIQTFTHENTTPPPSLVRPNAIEPAPKTPAADPSAPEPVKAVPVEVVAQPLTPADVLSAVIARVTNFMATAGAVIILAIFILLGREDLRDRILRLLGPTRLRVTTQALDDAAERVSRYLRLQLLVNVAFGILIGTGLFLIGVPNALLWGLLATMLRFVPYIGILIAAILPIMLAAAVDPGWAKPALTVGLFTLCEIVVANVIEPKLYGSGTGISPLGIIVSAAFWAWLWGPIGLLMSTPMTVCLVVIGRYVPAMNFLSILLGDEPALPPQTRFYQRLLALDTEEPAGVASEFLTDHTLQQFYDQVVIPALHLAEENRAQGMLDTDQQQFIREQSREVIEDLADHTDRPQAVRTMTEGEPQTAAAPPPVAVADANAPPQILCVPAYDETDELAALMLSQLLRRRGIPAAVISADLRPLRRMLEIERSKARIICISALPPFARTHAIDALRRIRARFPDAKIVLGLWHSGSDPATLEPRLIRLGADALSTRLHAAAEKLAAITPVQI